MEVSQFTYFQQVGGLDCAPVSGELTYGLERLAMYVQNVDNVYDLNFNGQTGDKRISYGDVFRQAEQEFSRYNFEEANTDILLKRFVDCENECKALLANSNNGNPHTLALPAYDQCIKASHTFNLLDARGVISVTERAGIYRSCARAGQSVLRGLDQECRGDAVNVLRPLAGEEFVGERP